MNREIVKNAINDFEPYFDKIKFSQMLAEDDGLSLNFNDLQTVFRKIKR